MITIKADCMTNAHTMLQTQATFLGNIGDDAYYVQDGHAWRITSNLRPEPKSDIERQQGYHGTIPSCVVSRSEDSFETDYIVRMMKSRVKANEHSLSRFGPMDHGGS